MQLLRYPAAAVQLDALTGLVALARPSRTEAQPWPTATAATWVSGPRLEELIGVLHVLTLKNTTSATSFSSEHSSWLLRCLGSVSTRQNPGSFSEWCQWMAVSASFEILETDFSGQQMQSQRLGMLKVHSKELLSNWSRMCSMRSSLTSPCSGVWRSLFYQRIRQSLLQVSLKI